jgi:hypothetical protein
VGRLLKAVYELQLDGSVHTEDEAREAARRMLQDELAGSDSGR